MAFLDFNYHLAAQLCVFHLGSHFLLIIPAQAGIHSGWEIGHLP
jgi:hypothetical protein